ncbi:MAG: BON domain-containing protein [Planctomycetes bacterium]|nr:BON domain-containing protein [Planctomycetota bacterium]
MSLKTIRGLAVVVCFSCAMPWANAGTTADGPSRDFRQTIQARKMLHDDPLLASVNLGVNVVEGVAFLWGPVPTAEFAARAEQRLRAMIELVDVRNRLYVTDEEPLTPLMQPTSPQTPLPQFLPDRSTPFESPAPRTPGNPRPLVKPGVELVRELEPIEPLTVNASPAANTETPTRRLPLFGTIVLPKTHQ